MSKDNKSISKDFNDINEEIVIILKNIGVLLPTGYPFTVNSGAVLEVEDFPKTVGLPTPIFSEINQLRSKIIHVSHTGLDIDQCKSIIIDLNKYIALLKAISHNIGPNNCKTNSFTWRYATELRLSSFTLVLPKVH